MTDQSSGGLRPGPGGRPLEVQAAVAPPDQFKFRSALMDLEPYAHEILDPAKAEDAPGQDLEPKRPDWVAACAKPRRVRLLEQPVHHLRYRGTELEPLYIWGSDDRRAYDDTRYPWGCVCKIRTAAMAGSGVIVGPRHVLTASHVVDWNRSGAGTVEVHRAGPAFSAATPITNVLYFKRVSINPGYSDLDEDYAVLITEDRIGDRFGWFGVRTYDSSWDDDRNWRNIGYPGDILGGAFPIYQRDKWLDEDEFDYGEARAMTTDADTAKGQSGGPIFGFWSGMPYVLAVVSAHGSGVFAVRDNWCSGGGLLTRLVRIARERFP